ncbi:hypothetical protein GO998_21755 (plasmid) [Ralstonia syzygii]|uniref:Type III effector protein n=2 Tax=Ralstonia syzygii TaxID=28097 RepID=A0ABX7ZLW3_9RALS|nr:hypothetical protein GO998_21755 [Ralstonia syzygii]
MRIQPPNAVSPSATRTDAGKRPADDDLATSRAVRMRGSAPDSPLGRLAALGKTPLARSPNPDSKHRPAIPSELACASYLEPQAIPSPRQPVFEWEATADWETANCHGPDLFTHLHDLLATYGADELAEPSLAEPSRATPAPPKQAFDWEASFDWQAADRHAPRLAVYLRELLAAYRANETPAVRDIDFAHEMASALNAADPALKLEIHDFAPHAGADGIRNASLTQRLLRGLGSGETWRAVLEAGGHRIALSVQHARSAHDVSLLLIDSVPLKEEAIKRLKNTWDDALRAMANATPTQLDAHAPEKRVQPVRLHLSVMNSKTQKTPDGCLIHALSATKKMASDAAIRTMHERLLQGLARGRVHAGVDVLNAGRHLPPAFFKHATSERVVDTYLDAKRTQFQASTARALAHRERPDWWHRPPVDPDAPVNRKGQTLARRQAGYMTQRVNTFGVVHTYSNSYEHKRIEIVRNTIGHLVAVARNSAL